MIGRMGKFINLDKAVKMYTTINKGNTDGLDSTLKIAIFI